MEPLAAGDPRQVGAYQLRARLGAGGMGRVFLGFSPAGRALAVKVIHAELAADPAFRVRFRREVAAAQSVSSAYTAPVVAADFDGDPPWLATVLVPGPSLAETVSTHGPLPAAAVWRLAAGLAEALQAIHSSGLVHRDLKPANVLLAANGPLVIDFGISRALEGTAMTVTGLVVGTPAFMSPEQAVGDRVAPASDVFALGAVIAFAATGTAPFGDGQPATVLFRVVHAPPALDALPGGLRELAASCLAKNPAERPPLHALFQIIGAGSPPYTARLTSFWPDSVADLIRAHQARLGEEFAGAGVAGSADPAIMPDQLRLDPARLDDDQSDGALARAAARSGAPPGQAAPTDTAPADAAPADAAPADAAPAGAAPAGAAPVDAAPAGGHLPPGPGAAGPAGPAGPAPNAGLANGGQAYVPQPPPGGFTTTHPGRLAAPGLPGDLAGGTVTVGPGGPPKPDPTRRRILTGLAAGAAAVGLAVTGWELSQGSPPAHENHGKSNKHGGGTNRRPSPTPGPSAPQAGTQLWTASLPAQVFSNAYTGVVVSGGVACVCDSDSYLNALSVANGNQLWRKLVPNGGGGPGGPVGGASPTDPIVVGGTVYVAGYYNDLRAFRAANGEKLWAVPIGSGVYSGIAVAGGAVFAVGWDSNLHAVSAAHGSTLWGASVPGGQITDPAAAGGAVYVVDKSNTMHAWGAAHGGALWTVSVPGGPSSGPVPVGSAVYIAAGDKKLHALRASNGSALWTVPIRGGAATAPAVADGVVYIAGADKNLYALHTAGGKTLWTSAISGGAANVTNTENSITIAPAAANGVVYVAGADSNLYALDASDGSQRWSAAIGAGRGACSSPVVAGNSVYIVCYDSNVYAFST